MAAASALVGTLPAVVGEKIQPSRVRPEPGGTTEPEEVAPPNRDLQALLGTFVRPTSVETKEQTVLSALQEWREAETDVIMAREITSALMRRNHIALPCGGFLLGFAGASLLAGFLAPLALVSLFVLGLGAMGVAVASIRAVGQE